MSSFLSVFKNILHGIEAAATVAAPIVATVDPTIGALINLATTSAVTVEAAIPADGNGVQKAAAVAGQSQAVIDVINGILASQGKAALPPNTNDIVQASVKTVVAGLNAVATAVQSPAKGG